MVDVCPKIRIIGVVLKPIDGLFPSARFYTDRNG
jgi:hypothetical protein